MKCELNSPIYLLMSVILLTAMPFVLLHFIYGSAVTDDAQLTISTGSLKGKVVTFRGIKVYQFLGIPFAEPPIGDLRFKKPLPVKSWNKLLNVDRWGPHCPQINFQWSEDCLYLNVFTSFSALNVAKNIESTNQSRSVMVWFYGGAFISGSANMPDLYDGTMLAALNDVIIVTVNYRIGPLGFLYLPEYGIPGNMGLWDQQLALQWVQDNIQYFDGDPGKVTIFGESAGSRSVSAHMVSPQLVGLFNKAIMQSGVLSDSNNTLTRHASSLVFLDKLNCSQSTATDVQSCLAAYKFGVVSEADSVSVGVVVGDEFIPDSIETAISKQKLDPNINILLGTVGYEGAFSLASTIDPQMFDPINPLNLTALDVRNILRKWFKQFSTDSLMQIYFADVDPNDSDKLRQILSKAVGDVQIACPAYSLGRKLVKDNKQSAVYAYYQSQKSITKPIYLFPSGSTWFPATHTNDLPFVFGYPFAVNETYDKEEVILSSIMMQTWTNFAKHGYVRDCMLRKIHRSN
uniref:Carboxylesterase type B domain-containing protein n=1 Tax=Tetranychus urticae TaxID=32264 RepID=T1JTH5_TETUR